MTVNIQPRSDNCEDLFHYYNDCQNFVSFLQQLWTFCLVSTVTVRICLGTATTLNIFSQFYSHSEHLVSLLQWVWTSYLGIVINECCTSLENDFYLYFSCCLHTKAESVYYGILGRNLCKIDSHHRRYFFPYVLSASLSSISSLSNLAVLRSWLQCCYWSNSILGTPTYYEYVLALWREAVHDWTLGRKYICLEL